MAVLGYTTTTSNDNVATYCYTVEGEVVNGYTIKASLYIYNNRKRWYYRFSSKAELKVDDEQIGYATMVPRREEDWEEGSWVIGNKTYNIRCLLVSGAKIVSKSGGNHTVSGLYTISTTSSILPKEGGEPSGTIWVEPSNYTVSIDHWTWGYKNGEGNNGDKSAYALGTTSFPVTADSSYIMNSSRAIPIPNGFALNNRFGGSSITGTWTTYSMPTNFTCDKDHWWEYDYDPISYSISYTMNGGTNNNSNPSSYNVLYGVTFANPTREHYTFKNWTIEGTAVTGINPGANASFSSVDDLRNKCASRTTGNKTVVANWTANTYKTSYNANGGSSTPPQQSVEYPGSINLASAISRADSLSNSNIDITIKYNANGGSNTPSNNVGTAVNTTTTKHTFENWHLNGVTGTAYAAGASYQPTSNATMYAGWTSNSSTTRTSNPSIILADGITRDNSTISSYIVTYNANGGLSTPSTQNAIKTREYSFSKWNTNAGGTGTDYNPNTEYTFDSNATLYAKWDTNDSGGSVTLANAISRDNSTLSSYIVSYNANGGNSTPDDQTAIKTREYTFNKWAVNSTNGTQYAAGEEYTPSANTTMYATWDTNDSGGSIILPAAISRVNGTAGGYTITYNANGGSGAPENQTSGNRTITYTFNKWAAGSTSGTQYAAGASYIPSDNTTMYALWNSSTSDNSSWTCSNIEPTRIGYTFLGWSEDQNATTATYISGTNYTITNNKTLYAVWQVNNYYINISGLLDGITKESTDDYGKYDVYINGASVATQVIDYCVEWPYGTQYEIKNITPDWGVKYNGVTKGSLTGILGAVEVDIQLSFTRLPVTLKANVNNEWKTGIMYVNVDGEWKKARALNIHHDGDWERLEKIDFTL